MTSWLAIGGLGMAGAWSVLVERPDVTTAARIAEFEGEDATALWERVAELSPRASEPRIRLGLIAEQRSDLAAAEQWLREAYAVDRQFETRWTLANFYFRHDRQDEFWTWIRSALEMSYGDRRPAFDLCRRMSSDSSEILARAIPEVEDVARDYLYYTIERHPEAVNGASGRVHDPDALLAATDALLGGQRYREAVSAWTRLGRPAPNGITGPDFEPPQTGRGFDWRIAESPGVTHIALEAGRGHRIRLSGKQSESVELLRQYVGGLQPGRRYRIGAEFSPSVAGVEWFVNGGRGPEFIAPAEVVLLTLRYERPRGEARAEAAFDIRAVEVLALH